MNQISISDFSGALHRGVYSIQQKISDLTSLETKVNLLFVLGRFLQAAAVVGFVGSLALAFVFTPLVVVGAVPALVTVVFGTVMANSPDEVLNFFLLEAPFIQGQPIGMISSGNNCWLDSALQMLFNASPSLFQKIQPIPRVTAFKQKYEEHRQAHQKIAHDLDLQQLRLHLCERTNAQIPSHSTQEDPAQLFEFLFQGENAIHTFYQQVDQGPLRIRREPLIQVDFGRQNQDFQELFDQYLDHSMDNGQRMKLFFSRAPEDLLIQAKRFIQVPNSVNSQTSFNKINEKLNIQPTLSLNASHLQSGGNVSYACDAFCVHYGQTPHSGHYVTYVKRGDTWWYCSSLTVRPVSLKDVSNAMKDGYLFHYHKM